MKGRFHSLALVIFFAFTVFTQPSFATQITFTQVPQNRDQSETQQGLPPDKKRSLSRYGPEDVFREQEMNDSRKSQSRRKHQSTSGSNSVPASKTSASPPSPTSPEPVAAAPGPTIVATSLDNNQERRQTLGQLTPAARFAPRWTVPLLSALALIVFAALLYVLNKIRGFIKVST